MSNDKQSLKEKLAKKIADQEVKAPKNPYWAMENGQIIDESMGGYPIMIQQYKPLLDVVAHYFKHVHAAMGTEAQVIVFDSDTLLKLDMYGMPRLELPTRFPNLHVFVLPQDNSWGGTTISEAWWQKNIASKGISPVMRIHSHHTMEAYQSHTDWSTLNSNTLEVVIGRIQNDTPAIGYWLDILGTDNKETVFYTDDYGQTVSNIPCGKTKRPHPDVPTPVDYSL